MLDARSSYLEYLNDRLKPVENLTRWSVVRTVLLAFLLAVMIIDHRAVEAPWFEIPPPIQDYLLQFTLWRFNVNDFRQLCVSNGLTANMISLLLFLYCTFSAAMVMIYVVTALDVGLRVRARRRRRMVGANRLLFYRVMRLHAALEQLSHTPGSSANKRQATRLVRDMDLYATVSPLRREWRSDPVYRWFDQSALSSTTIRVLAALRGFKEKALYCLRNGHDISQLADAVDELATFLYSVSLQGQTEYRPPRPEPRPEEAARALARFADALNRVQVKSERRAPLVRRLWQSVRGGLESRYTQSIVAIALVAALVIFLGALMFRIPAGTAFLAWVSIVFGSTLLGVALQIPDIRKPAD